MSKTIIVNAELILEEILLQMVGASKLNDLVQIVEWISGIFDIIKRASPSVLVSSFPSPLFGMESALQYPAPILTEAIQEGNFSETTKSEQDQEGPYFSNSQDC